MKLLSVIMPVYKSTKPERLVLFALLKLRMWRIIQIIYPEKRYKAA